MHRESTDGGAAGPLRNGNPRGDPNLAPRCGAKNRAAVLSVPGAGDEEWPVPHARRPQHGAADGGGAGADRAAKTTHGFYTAESREARRRADAFVAETRALLAELRKVGVGEGEAPRGVAVRAGGKRAR